MASSFNSSPREYNDNEFDDLDSNDFTDRELSDEDTEDASETDAAKQETQYTEIKEQMYQDKLAHLKKQLQQLEDGTLPEYLKRKKKIEQQHKERLKVSDIFKEYEVEVIEREYIKEKKLAFKDFEEKKIDLKENLIADLEEKKRSIELERSSLELSGGSTHFILSTSLDAIEIKPVTTRKLRRRPNDPIPLPEKRRKPSPAQLNLFLDEVEIMDDLRIINKVSGKPINRKQLTPVGPVDMVPDVKIDDGRLYYDKRWFHRNQPVIVECRDTGKFSGVITAVGTQEVTSCEIPLEPSLSPSKRVKLTDSSTTAQSPARPQATRTQTYDIWIRKTSDSSKIKIYLSQLQKGKFILRRKQT